MAALPRPLARVEFGYVLPDGSVLWRPGRMNTAQAGSVGGA